MISVVLALGHAAAWAAMSSSTTWEPLPPRAASEPPRQVLLHNFYDTQIPYADAWDCQRRLLGERTAALKAKSASSGADVLIALQHPPVLTLGTSSTIDNVLSSSDPPFDLFRTERGGEVTYHGPGQIVLYPLLDLRAYRQDVHWYMRALEEVVIRTLGSLGLPAGREPGLTGVWVDGAKACAIGVKLSRWVSMHGLALNVEPDLEHFGHIVPCGIADKPVTSIAELLRERGYDAGGAPLLERVQRLLLQHFAEVFECELEEQPRGAAPRELLGAASGSRGSTDEAVLAGGTEIGKAVADTNTEHLEWFGEDGY